MKLRLAAPLLGLLLVLSACSKPAPAPTALPSPTPEAEVSVPPSSTPEATPTPAPTPRPAPVWGEQASDCSRAAEDGTVLVEGSFRLPRIENAGGVSAYEAVNDWYLDLSAGLRSDTLMNESLAADDYAVSKAVGDPFSGYSDEESFEIAYETPALVNVLRTHIGYAGGVYPTLLYLSDFFDLSTGAPLSFADFFTDPDRAAELALTEILRQAAVREDTAQLSADSLRGVFRREDFYLADGALVFFFQPSLLGPTTADRIEFPLPLSLFGELYVSHD